MDPQISPRSPFQQWSTVISIQGDQQLQQRWVVPPFPGRVITRIFTCFRLGNPELNPSFASITWEGGPTQYFYPVYRVLCVHGSYSIWLVSWFITPLMDFQPTYRDEMIHLLPIITKYHGHPSTNPVIASIEI